MDYKSYLSNVNELIVNMSSTEKDEWILKQAVMQTELNRERFLQSLSGEQAQDNMTMEMAMECFEKIENRQMHFACQGYEDYENHWSDEWTYEYEDAYGVGAELDRLLEFFGHMIETQRYQEGLRLADLILELECTAADESGGDDIELTFQELYENGLLQFPLARFSALYLRGLYYFESGDTRCRLLTERMKESLWRQCKLEDLLMACSLAPPEIQSFLLEFIAWIGEESGERESELILEAGLLVGGVRELERIALKYGKNYPALFLKCCEELLVSEHDYERCGKVAKAAMEQLDGKLLYRGKAAVLGARAAEHSKDGKDVRSYREEAFRSESSVMNLLHMLTCDYEAGEYVSLLESLSTHVASIACVESYGYYDRGQYAANTLGTGEKTVLGFFLADAEESIRYCRNSKKELGWSNDPEGVIVPLFLACITKQGSMTKAMRAVLSRISLRCATSEVDVLWALLVLWREKHFSTDESSCIHWLEEEVLKRTEAVVGGGYRSSYIKAAELVVALDEIFAEKGLRKWGETREAIRKLHSRKTAFKKEIESLK